MRIHFHNLLFYFNRNVFYIGLPEIFLDDIITMKYYVNVRILINNNK